MSGAGAAALARALARVSAYFPATLVEARLSLPSLNQAALVIARLLNKLPDQAARDEVARQVAVGGSSLPFQIALRGWLRPPGEADHAVCVISDAAAAAVQMLIVDGISTLAEEGPLYDTVPSEAARYYTFWARWGDRADIRPHLEAAFAEDPASAERFLESFVTTTPLGRRGLFREQYAAITAIVDPDWLVTHLPVAATHGAAPSTNGQAERADGGPASAQFVRLHRQLAAGDAGAHAPPPEMVPEPSGADGVAGGQDAGGVNPNGGGMQDDRGQKGGEA